MTDDQPLINFRSSTGHFTKTIRRSEPHVQEHSEFGCSLVFAPPEAIFERGQSKLNSASFSGNHRRFKFPSE